MADRDHTIPLDDKAQITFRTPAAHIAVWGGTMWAWTGTCWRPAMRFETDVSRELVRSLRRTDRGAETRRLVEGG